MKQPALINKIKAFLSTHYKRYYFIKISDRFVSGILDCFLCVNGRSIWIELKSENDKPEKSPQQIFTVCMIRKAGGEAFYAFDIGCIESILSRTPCSCELCQEAEKAIKKMEAKLDF